MNLGELQKAVHVAKDKKNDFGGYNYRTAEGILAAIKAALPEGASITVTDDLRDVAGQIFVQSDATVDLGDGVTHTAKGFAMHPLTKKGMDPSQITGSASSYARKYALSGLVALDDGSADPDAAKEPFEPAPKPDPAIQTADNMIEAIRKHGVGKVTGDPQFIADFSKLEAANKEQWSRVKSEIETQEAA